MSFPYTYEPECAICGFFMPSEEGLEHYRDTDGDRVCSPECVIADRDSQEAHRNDQLTEGNTMGTPEYDLAKHLHDEDEADMWQSFCESVEEEIRADMKVVVIPDATNTAFPYGWEIQDAKGGTYRDGWATSEDDARKQAEASWEDLAVQIAKDRAYDPDHEAMEWERDCSP